MVVTFPGLWGGVTMGGTIGEEMEEIGGGMGGAMDEGSGSTRFRKFSERPD